MCILLILMTSSISTLLGLWNKMNVWMNVACRPSLDSCILITHTELCCGLFVKVRVTAGKTRTVSSNTMSPAGSPYTAVWEFTHRAQCCVGQRPSWKFVRKPENPEPFRATPCPLLTLHIPLYVSSHTEHSVVSDSALRESSWGSRKTPNRFEQHHVPCWLSIYRCMRVDTQSTVLCRTASFVKVREAAGKPRTVWSNTMSLTQCCYLRWHTLRLDSVLCGSVALPGPQPQYIGTVAVRFRMFHVVFSGSGQSP